MITLLKIGGGASDFTVDGHALSPADWLSVKSGAARLLTARGAADPKLRLIAHTLRCMAT